MTPIDSLSYRQHVIDTLPADPKTTVTPRQVHGACYSRVAPTAVSKPALVGIVPDVAALLDLDPNPSPELVQVLAGNRLAPGMVPYASCYGGHQFGNWAGQLGDGRAITLGEVENARGEVWEMQLKGAGPTPYSRHADGRAVLRSSLREYVCSEAMFHLGVPTTRALSLVTTGDAVVRDMLYDGHPEPEPGAIVCRVAPTFLRFGNFEIFASRDDKASLRTLVDFTLARHYPQYADDLPGFFTEVCRRTARTVAHWMRVGFVHGVMNTDNLSILGLTIDYGPYGFLEPFDPGWTPNTTDAGGKRYRYGNQPRIAQWNLAQLGTALLALHEDVPAFERGLEVYNEEFSRVHRELTAQKLGLAVNDACIDEDRALVEQLFALLSRVETDFTLFFRRLADVPAWGASLTSEAAFAHVHEAYYDPEVDAETLAALGSWVETYRERVRAEATPDDARRARMNGANPMYVPRNWLLQETIDRVARGDLEALRQLEDVLRTPYQEKTGREAYAAKRPEWARHRAGCSMLSCSS